MTQHFAFFLKSERVEENYRVLIALLTAYLFLGLIVVFLDLGNTIWGQAVAQLGRWVIPSIEGTAEITSSSNSAAMLLTIAWIWGWIMYAPIASLLMCTKHQVVNWEHVNRTSWTLKIGLWLGILTGIFVLAHVVPANAAGIERIIFSLLNTSPLYVVFWGMIIWSTVWLGLLLPTIGFISLVKKFYRGEKI